MYHEEVEDLEVRSLWAPPRHIETKSILFLLCGDQNAGKTTFLHAFTDESSRLFLALHSYLPMLSSTQLNSRLVETNPSDEGAFLDTDLACVSILLSVDAFRFFCMEAGLDHSLEHWGCVAGVTEYMNLQFIELGGDHIDRMIVDENMSYSQEYQSLQPEQEHRILHLREETTASESKREDLEFVVEYNPVDTQITPIPEQKQVEFRLEQLLKRTNTLQKHIPSVVYTINLGTLGCLLDNGVYSFNVNQWKLVLYRLEYIMGNSHTQAISLCLNRSPGFISTDTCVNALHLLTNINKDTIREHVEYKDYVYNDTVVSIYDIIKQNIPFSQVLSKPVVTLEDPMLATPPRCMLYIHTPSTSSLWEGVIPAQILVHFSMGAYCMLDTFLQLFYTYYILQENHTQITRISCYHMQQLNEKQEVDVSNAQYHTRQLLTSFDSSKLVSFKLEEELGSTMRCISAYIQQSLYSSRDYDGETGTLDLYSGEMYFIDDLEEKQPSIPARSFLQHYARTCHALHRGGLVQMSLYEHYADVMYTYTSNNIEYTYTPLIHMFPDKSIAECVEQHQIQRVLKCIFLEHSFQQEYLLSQRWENTDKIARQVADLCSFSEVRISAFLSCSILRSLASSYLLHPCVRQCYLPYISALQYTLLSDDHLDPLYFHVNDNTITLPTLQACLPLQSQITQDVTSLFSITYTNMLHTITSSKISLLHLEDICLLHTSLSYLPRTISIPTKYTFL